MGGEILRVYAYCGCVEPRPTGPFIKLKRFSTHTNGLLLTQTDCSESSRISPPPLVLEFYHRQPFESTAALSLDAPSHPWHPPSHPPTRPHARPGGVGWGASNIKRNLSLSESDRLWFLLNICFLGTKVQGSCRFLPMDRGSLSARRLRGSRL